MNFPTHNGPDYFKIFQQRRLNPSIPEHKMLIDRFLAYLSGQPEHDPLYRHYYPEKAAEVSGRAVVEAPADADLPEARELTDAPVIAEIPAEKPKKKKKEQPAADSPAL